MIKPYLQFSIICLEVYEEEKMPPSFLNVIYEIPVPSFPFKFPAPLFIVNGWCKGKGEFFQSMKILNPDKKSVLAETDKQPFTLNEIETPFMNINGLADIVFEKSGQYWVQVFLYEKLSEKQEMFIEYPLTLRKADPIPISTN